MEQIVEMIQTPVTLGAGGLVAVAIGLALAMAALGYRAGRRAGRPIQQAMTRELRRAQRRTNDLQEERDQMQMALESRRHRRPGMPSVS